jgi:hypothetical protein
VAGSQNIIVEVRLHAFLTSALGGGEWFTPRPLYAQYPLDRRLCGPQSRSGRGSEEKYLIIAPAGN